MVRARFSAPDRACRRPVLTIPDADSGNPNPPEAGRNCRIQADSSRLSPVETESVEKPENRSNSARKVGTRRLTELRRPDSDLVPGEAHAAPYCFSPFRGRCGCRVAPGHAAQPSAINPPRPPVTDCPSWLPTPALFEQTAGPGSRGTRFRVHCLAHGPGYLAGRLRTETQASTRTCRTSHPGARIHL